MPTRFNLPHIDIAQRRITRPYQAPREHRGGGGAPRIREEHGARLRAELAATFQEADAARPEDERLEPADGVYLEVELRRRAKADDLERRRAGIKPGAVRLEENESETVALYVPDEARPVLEQILEDYREGEQTPRGEPPRKTFVEPIESIRKARLETFWTDDPDALPEDPRQVFWWEVWCFKGTEAKLDQIVEALGARAADQDHRLFFPEVTVIPVLTDRITIELMLFATFAISELRRASASPVFFTDAEREDQYGWAENLAERTVWPGAEAPAVCLFDTGVNRAHVLLEPALSPDDMTAIYPDWGVADEPEGHGTGMAGLALHGRRCYKTSLNGGWSTVWNRSRYCLPVGSRAPIPVATVQLLRQQLRGARSLGPSVIESFVWQLQMMMSPESGQRLGVLLSIRQRLRLCQATMRNRLGGYLFSHPETHPFTSSETGF